MPVHESNARDVASYLIEFTQENLGALPRIITSARLGLVGEGLVLPGGSVGYAEPVQYAGRLPIRFGSDATAYPHALQAICTWPEAWAAWIIPGLALAGPLIARIRPRRNPACYLAGESGSGKTTLAQFAVGCWGDPTGKPFLVEAHRTTAAGFRQSLTDLNGLPLLIDEAHTTSDPQRLEALVYEFANGQSYSKGTAEGSAAGGEPLRGSLILAGEALPEFRHAGAGKRVLWLDCTRSLPLGAGTPGRPGSDEHRPGGQRAEILEHAWEAGAGLFGRTVAERCWTDWAAVLTDYRRIRDAPALQPLAAWRESLALNAVVLQVSDLYAELSRCANGVYALERIDTPAAMQAHLADLRPRISTVVLSPESGLLARMQRAFAQPATTPGPDEAPAYHQLQIAISLLTGLAHSPALLAQVPQAQERLDALWERMLNAQLRMVEEGLIILREANANLDQWLSQPH